MHSGEACQVFKYVDMSGQGVALMPAAQLVETDWSLPRWNATRTATRKS